MRIRHCHAPADAANHWWTGPSQSTRKCRPDWRFGHSPRIAPRPNMLRNYLQLRHLQAHILGSSRPPIPATHPPLRIHAGLPVQGTRKPVIFPYALESHLHNIHRTFASSSLHLVLLRQRRLPRLLDYSLIISTFIGSTTIALMGLALVVLFLRGPSEKGWMGRWLEYADALAEMTPLKSCVSFQDMGIAI